MNTAIVRKISPGLAKCELTYISRDPIDLGKADVQHQMYVSALEKTGLNVLALPSDENLPDSCFVEDTAVVLDEFAIITRPGTKSRQSEVALIAETLSQFRELKYIKAPGTLEGGDVLRIGKNIFVGLSSRTNGEGIRQFAEHCTPYGYRVQSVRVSGCLHLKTGVTYVGENKILLNPAWVESDPFREYEPIEVCADEPFAANTLLVNGSLFHSRKWTKTRARLDEHGLRVSPLDISELEKAEAGLTCLSLIW